MFVIKFAISRCKFTYSIYFPEHFKFCYLHHVNFIFERKITSTHLIISTAFRDSYSNNSCFYFILFFPINLCCRVINLVGSRLKCLSICSQQA